MNTERTLGPRGRILIAKLGLDGHDRGAKILTRLLRDEGFEVIYLGVRNTAEQVARVAMQEWVDVVGVSLLSGAHVELAHALRQALDSQGMKHVPIAIGGLIPAHDSEALSAVGVARCFHPGQDTEPTYIAEAMDELVTSSRHSAEAIPH